MRLGEAMLVFQLVIVFQLAVIAVLLGLLVGAAT